jgi:hypothetical protein
VPKFSALLYKVRKFSALLYNIPILKHNLTFMCYLLHLKWDVTKSGTINVTRIVRASINVSLYFIRQ